MSDYFNQVENQILEELAEADSRANEMLLEVLKPKKARILEWNTRCEKEVASGNNEELLNNQDISAYMASKIREKKRPDGQPISEGVIRWVREVLPTTSKRAYAFQNEKIDLGNGTVAQFGGNSDSSANGELGIPKLKPIDKLTHSDAVEVANLVKKAKEINQYMQDYGKKAQEKADEENWTDVKIAKLQSTGPDLPEPRRGPYHDMLRELGQEILDYASKVEKYPPTEEDEKRYVDATLPFLQFMRTVNDEKYTQSLVGWMGTIKTMEAGHKHAAAVLHGGPAKIKEYYQDADGNDAFRWIEVKRDFTREQVGDVREGILDLAISIIQNEGVWFAIADSKDKHSQPFIRGRKVKMHEEFSEKAFSGGGNLEA